MSQWNSEPMSSQYALPHFVTADHISDPPAAPPIVNATDSDVATSETVVGITSDRPYVGATFSANLTDAGILFDSRPNNHGSENGSRVSMGQLTNYHRPPPHLQRRFIGAVHSLRNRSSASPSTTLTAPDDSTSGLVASGPPVEPATVGVALVVPSSNADAVSRAGFGRGQSSPDVNEAAPVLDTPLSTPASEPMHVSDLCRIR